MILFIYTNVKGYTDKNIAINNRTSRSQRIIIYLSHLMGFLIVFFQSLNLEVVFLYLQQVGFIVLFFFFYNRFYKDASRMLLNNIMYLQIISYMILTRLSFDTGAKQFNWSVLSGVITFLVPFILLHLEYIVFKIKWIYAIVGFILLVAVSFYGQEIYGAQNWIIIGEYSFQPSELVTIVFIFFVASMFRKDQSFKNVVLTSMVTLVYISILIYQKDLGIALIFFIIYMVMLYVATSNWLYFFGGLLGASIVSRIAYTHFYHVQRRVMAWLNPWAHISDQGFQIAHGLFAIGAGGWFGVGLGKGMPNRIPVVDSDMIFPAITEEFGAFFAIGLILIMLSIFFVGLKISRNCNSFFYMQIGVGISCAYAFRVFSIIGGSTKLIPLTGLTLPFVSYGGSSLFSSYLMIAVLQGILIINNRKIENSSGDINDKKEES